MSRPRRPWPATTTARQAMGVFVTVGLVALLLISTAALFASRRAAESEALRDALSRTTTLGRGLVEPALSTVQREGTAKARQDFDRVMRERMLIDPIRRVKLWTADGEVLWSDEQRLVGARFELEPRELALLHGDTAAAEPADVTREENVYERGLGPLIEVYVPVRTSDGRRLLLETYQSRTGVLAEGQDLLDSFAPIVVGGVTLLLVGLLPLVWSLSRSLERSRADRARLLEVAVEASAAERRRIAAHLHDGPVQSLAGSAFALSGIADTLGRGPGATTVREVAGDLRESVRSLRSLLVEIYPPSLDRTGLPQALADLSAALRSRRIEVSLDLDEGMELPPHARAALFRTAQEALRNVVEHAEARSVHIRLSHEDDGTALLALADDGRGFDARQLDDGGLAPSGDSGLALLGRTLHDLGGRLVVRAAPGRGTVVLATVPES